MLGHPITREGTVTASATAQQVTARLAAHPLALLASGVLGAASMGLPWSRAQVGQMPLLVETHSDGVWAGAIVNMGGTTVTTPGMQQPIRVVAALAAALIWFGVRRGEPGLARLGLVTAFAGLLVALRGAVLPGHLVYLAALALAVHGLAMAPVVRLGSRGDRAVRQPT